MTAPSSKEPTRGGGEEDSCSARDLSLADRRSDLATPGNGGAGGDIGAHDQASEQMPALAPFMVCGLTYAQAVDAMKATGCAIRRPHWCFPVLVMGKRGKPVIDDEGEIRPFRQTADDRRADDWMMVEREEEGAA